MLDPKQSRKVLDQVLAAGKKLGGDVRASLTSRREGNVRFGRGEITSSAEVEEHVIEVTVSFGKRHASSTANQIDAAALTSLVERAARLARLSPEDPEWMPPLPASPAPRAADGFDEATAKNDAPARAALAGAAIAVGAAGKLDMSGFFLQRAGSTALATSAGLSRHDTSTHARLSCTARTRDGRGSGWAGLSSHRAGDLDAAALAAVAADKAQRSQSPRALPPGRYTVILEPAAVSELLAFMTYELDQRTADEGRSYFAKAGGATRVGEAILPERITLRSDPADVAAGGQPWNDEGVSTPARAWIDRGTLTVLPSSRFWADRQKRPHVAKPTNWELVGGKADSKELLAGVERGLWITRFWYARTVDPRTILTTGLTRDGVFLIEKGQIVGPVNNFRWNESPLGMLKNADVFGPTAVVPGSNIRAPILRTHDFNMASVSEAV